MNYNNELDQWNALVANAIGPQARIVSVSNHCSDCRVYSCDDHIVKIRRFSPASQRNRANSLEDEAVILGLLGAVPGVPSLLGYQRIGEFEVLKMSKLPSVQGFDPTFGYQHEPIRNFIRVAKMVATLNFRGVSHGDIHISNIGVNREGTISVFDFDQACIDAPWRCLARDYFGFDACSVGKRVSLVERAQTAKYLSLPARGIALLRRLISEALNSRDALANQKKIGNYRLLTELAGDSSLRLLAEAWDTAAKASASSPGITVAYYSLDICGIHFPGERPWMFRWLQISGIISFKGKKLLELGCNMGLLSIHAQISGAGYCKGIDIDPVVLESARKAAAAFGVTVHFEQQNLDSDDCWEAALDGFDLISVLSVMHWVKQKERLWKFIGGHREVIYEGHESESEARSSLAKVGFRVVSVIGYTERARPLFYAHK